MRAKYPVRAAVTRVHVRGYPLRVVPSCCLVLPLHAFRCSICFRWHRMHSISVCTVSMPRRLHHFELRIVCWGWVTFVHHSVAKVHVRLLLALGYDSSEYFIFFIPLNTFGFGHITWPTLHLFTFEFNESSRAPAHGPGPNGICKPTLVFGRSPAGVLKLCTCISFHVFCMAFPACIFARFSMCTSFAWCSACMHELNMCRAAVHHFPLAAALLTASFFILFTATTPLCHLCMSGRGAAPPCISLFDLFPMASNAFHFGLHGLDASAFASLRTSYRLLGLGHVCAPFGSKSTCPSAACIRI